MAFISAQPIVLEQINCWKVEAFSVELGPMRFTYTLGMYMDEARVRTRVVDVQQSELLAVMQEPLAGETIYAAIRRTLYAHARAAGHIPPAATDDASGDAGEDAAQE